MCLLDEEMTEEVILPSDTSSSSSMSTPEPREVCLICGDKVNNKRYGAPACLGCTVFFKRTVAKNQSFKCLRGRNCIISYACRCFCRACRFAKCLKVGLRARSIQKRDVLGPRKRSTSSSSGYIGVNVDDNFFGSWVQFQQKQQFQSSAYFAEHNVNVAFHVDSQNTAKYRRRAQAHDVQVMLKLSLKQAMEWGERLKPFKKLSIDSKKSVMAEYFLAFLLIDQAYKTAKETDLEVWLLPNCSFLHPDYFFGFPQATIDMETLKLKAQIHHNFVSDILTTVIQPFRKLRIDKIECAALKTLLLLRPSCSEQSVFSGHEEVLADVDTNCMDELMNHCLMKFPKNGVERFGEILLLISSIRCGVKTIYNHTRVSDMFSFMNFDDSVKDVFLS